MGLIEVLLIGIGLSMDATAVCMTNMMAYKGSPRSKVLAQPVFFGLFQMFMTIAGYYASSFFTGFMMKYSGMVAFLILGIIGAKMLYDAFKREQGCTYRIGNMTYKVLLFQAVATSIDALAVGVGFGALQVSILYASVTIGVTTAICSLIAVWLGRKCRDFLGRSAEILGGVILIAIGVKALF